jgi:hypothetical protein
MFEIIVENVMGFKNEYLSNQEIKELGLDKVLLSHCPGLKDRKTGELASYYEVEWTVDKERNIYLIYIGRMFPTEAPTLRRWILGIENESALVDLDMTDKSSFDEEKNIITKVWRLREIDLKQFSGRTKVEIMDILKELLSANRSVWTSEEAKFIAKFEF